MSLISTANRIVETAPLPDAATRLGIRLMVGHTRRQLANAPRDGERSFAANMARHSIAEHPDRANAQHYELPPEFFKLCLGPRRKYSCCLYDEGADTLAQAEVRALEETIAHAGLADGQRILELGCGWGSLTLFMAERFPNAAITAVSNSAPQGWHIEQEAKARGLSNISIVTADMNDFVPASCFDRIVSVEMFEHMANWQALLRRVRTWLKADGRFFMHVFTHAHASYRFNHQDEADWIAQHFFTGGIMPSRGLIQHFPDLFAVEQEWSWSGRHYARTAMDWLAKFDANRTEIGLILQSVYGADAELWRRRWRLFFLATAGLFGHHGGQEWGVSHYLLRPTPAG